MTQLRPMGDGLCLGNNAVGELTFPGGCDTGWLYLCFRGRSWEVPHDTNSVENEDNKEVSRTQTWRKN